MNPLFSVGEVVILQSISSPESNGEYAVMDIQKGKFNNLLTGLEIDAVGYKLDTEWQGWWMQEALRKKHQPGEQSFAELMQTLKSPVSV